MGRGAGVLLGVVLTLFIVNSVRADEKVLTYESGATKARYEHTVTGVLHGRYQVFHENGQLKVSGYYNSGNKVGQWILLDVSGDTTRVENHGGSVPAPETDSDPEAATFSPVTRAEYRASAAGFCNPPCRKGFTCKDGNCVSRCNPPCPAGTYCSENGADCVPLSSAYKPNKPKGPKTWGDCTEQGDCAIGYICFNNDCEDEPTIVSAGNIAFGITTAFCGAITQYAYTVPISQAVNNYRKPVADYNGGGYGTDEVLSTLFPVTIGYALFGGLSHLSKAKQSAYLRSLGASPDRVWNAAAGGMYALTVATSIVTVVSFASDQQEFATSMTVINAAMLTTSLVFNAIAYGKNRSLLKKAVAQKSRFKKVSDVREPRFIPYVCPVRGGMHAGLAVTLGR